MKLKQTLTEQLSKKVLDGFDAMDDESLENVYSALVASSRTLPNDKAISQMLIAILTVKKKRKSRWIIIWNKITKMILGIEN